MSEELKPCPFCGSNDITNEVDDGIAWQHCKRCDATGPTINKRDAEPYCSWNDRYQAAKASEAGSEPVAETLTLDNAPVGTMAPAASGGHWTRVKSGWKWCTGSTFPRPGGSWTGDLIPPSDCLSAQQAEADPVAWVDAVKRLVRAARTTGGTAGPDDELMSACAQCEDLLSSTPPAPAPVVPDAWHDVEAKPPETGFSVIGYSPDWVDEDFNPHGVRECFPIFCDDWIDYWISAKWVDRQDCFSTDTETFPTHWKPMIAAAPQTESQPEPGAIITVYDQGASGPHSVQWDRSTGAVRVLPDGQWLVPGPQTKKPAASAPDEDRLSILRRQHEVLRRFGNAIVFGENNQWAVTTDDGCLQFHPQWSLSPEKKATHIWPEAVELINATGGHQELVVSIRDRHAVKGALSPDLFIFDEKPEQPASEGIPVGWTMTDWAQSISGNLMYAVSLIERAEDNPLIRKSLLDARQQIAMLLDTLDDQPASEEETCRWYLVSEGHGVALHQWRVGCTQNTRFLDSTNHGKCPYCGRRVEV